MLITYGFAILALSTIPSASASIISLRSYSRTSYPHFKLMAITWFFLSAGVAFLALSYLFLDLTAYRIGIFITVPLMYSVIFLVDTVSQQKIDPVKIFIATVAASLTFIYGLEPDSVGISVSALGEEHPVLMGKFMLAGSLAFIVSGTYWLYYMVKIYYFCPPSIKKYARVNLLGAILMGPGSALAFASGFVWIFPGTDYLLISIGSLLCTYSFQREPKLGYILPFKVYHLIVIDTKSGIPLFTHNWEETEETEIVLFSSALKAISSILDESLNKGFIREIIFTRALLIIHQPEDSRIIYALVASKSNEILRHGLVLFDKLFRQTYQRKIKENISLVSQFEEAVTLTERAFPFVV